MTMAKAADLDPDLQRQLGFAPDHARVAAVGATAKTSTNQLAEETQPNPSKQAKPSEKLRALLEVAKQRAQDEAEQVQAEERFEHATVAEKMIGYSVLTGIFVLYFFFCHACQQLCRRTGSPSTFFVWLPGLKRLALYRATNTSWWWFFLGLLLPVFGLLIWFIGWVLCCLRLCDAFQQTRWWTLLMLVPILGWIPFIYFSSITRAEDNEPAVRSIRSGYAF